MFTVYTGCARKYKGSFTYASENIGRKECRIYTSMLSSVSKVRLARESNFRQNFFFVENLAEKKLHVKKKTFTKIVRQICRKLKFTRKKHSKKKGLQKICHQHFPNATLLKNQLKDADAEPLNKVYNGV